MTGKDDMVNQFDVDGIYSAFDSMGCIYVRGGRHGNFIDMIVCDDHAPCMIFQGEFKQFFDIHICICERTVIDCIGTDFIAVDIEKDCGNFFMLYGIFKNGGKIFSCLAFCNGYHIFLIFRVMIFFT